MITGTVPPPRPAVFDTTFNYKELEGRFYARSDIDHRIYIRDKDSIWVNPDTGEIRSGRK